MQYLSRVSQSIVVCLITIFISISASFANPVIPVPTSPQQPTFTPSAPKLKAKAFILVDATTGKIIAQKDADKRVPPASLTKLMSMYIISSALKGGQLRLDDKVRVSQKAWKTEGSRMFLKPGSEVPVKDLIQGIIVASGNDATVALAEYLAGTEEAFADIMNQQAQILGMKDSHFIDSTGLPNKDHYSTAHDLATLSRAYVTNFPEDYSYYSEKWFTYNGIKQPNRNRLLWRYRYADGLKTGHTREAGFCLVASAKKDGMRLISVVLGTPNDTARTDDSIRLLNYGFRFYENHKLYDADKPVAEARVWEGKKTNIPLGITEDFYVTVPKGTFKRIKADVAINNPLKAPVVKGQQYGTINIKLNDELIASKPLIALDDSPKGGLLRRAADLVQYSVSKYFTKTDTEINRS